MLKKENGAGRIKIIEGFLAPRGRVCKTMSKILFEEEPGGNGDTIYGIDLKSRVG
jgi:hypothetical protein